MKLETPLTCEKQKGAWSEVKDSKGGRIFEVKLHGYEHPYLDELVRRANAFDAACELIQFVVDKYHVKSPDEFTCELHRKLAEHTQPTYAKETT